MSLQDAIDNAVDVPRIKTGIEGVDHVLGGGFAEGSAILLCGDPGAGKTSIILKAFQAIAKKKHPLYITGEQTLEAVANRAKQFGAFSARMAALRETDLATILEIVDERRPDIVAIDSLQTLVTDRDWESGSAMSIKSAVHDIVEFIEETGITFILVGHITKGGALAGPKTLEHQVDVNLWLSNHPSGRILRCESKNRYGEVPRRARFEMTENGLQDRYRDDLEKSQLEKELAEQQRDETKSIPLSQE